MSTTPTALGVPEHARGAWQELHDQITRAGDTPCADPAMRDAWTGSAGEQEIAARLCLACPVMVACATYARAAGETEGVWGATTPSERRTR